MGTCSTKTKVETSIVEAPKSPNISVNETSEDLALVQSAKSNEYTQYSEFLQITTNIQKNRLSNNLELYSLIWCDANVDKTEENIQTQMKLRSSINYIQTFDNMNECEEFIKGVKYEKVVLIVSGNIGQSMVPRIHALQQLTSVYVYCGNRVQHETWAKNYKKIVAVIDDPYILLENISKDQKAREQAQLDSTPLNFFDPSNKTHGSSLKSLTTENGSFLYFQLMMSVLLSMKPIFDWEKTTKERLVKMCKENYENNTEDLEILDEFDRNYTASDAIRWYTRDCCLYKLLNKALRVQDIKMLVAFRFLICDIFELLSNKSKDFFSTNESEVFVYRGQALGIEELNRLKPAIGEYISVNSFLSTSRSRNVAFQYAVSSINTDYVKRILFEIKINVTMNLPVDKPFACIAEMSYFHREEEVLFMIGSIFKVETVVYDQNNDLWVVKLILCSEDDYELKDEFKCIKEELIGKADGEGQPIATLAHLGSLLENMGDFDEAEKCYKEMLTELADEHYNDQENQGQFIFANIVRCSNLKRCYIGLRNIANRRNNKELALEYEENAKTIGDALQSVIEAFASQFQDQSASAEPNYTKMAKEYWNQGEFDLALENYEKAIEKYSENDNNDQLSKCHYESALVCQDAKMWDQALEHFFSVLNIKKLILPKNHPDIASIYCDIGKVFIEKRDCVGALEHFEQAHKIYVLCLPPQHPEMGRLLLLMGLAHVGNGDKSTARQIIGEGISIVRQSDPEKAAELENQFIALCN